MPIRSLAKNYSQKNFTGGQRTTCAQGGWDQTAAHSSIIFSHIILISITDKKWNPLWHLISILDNQVYT